MIGCLHQLLGNYTINKLQSLCYPVLWFALQYGASPIQPQKDACHLEVDGEEI